MRDQFDFEDERLAADAPIGRDAESTPGEPWQPPTLEIRELASAERERFQTRWLAEVRGQLLVDPVVAAENADALVQELMHVRGYPVDPFDWHVGGLTTQQAELVRSYHDVQQLATAHDSRHAVRAVQQYHHLFDELLESSATGLALQ
jgi:hypothetical protein